MTYEDKLRREMSRLLIEIDTYPYKKDRESMLWDILRYTASLLQVKIEYQDK